MTRARKAAGAALVAALAVVVLVVVVVNGWWPEPPAAPSATRATAPATASPSPVPPSPQPARPSVVAPSAAAPSSPSPSAAPADPALAAARRQLDSLDLPRRVGQLFMVKSAVAGPDAVTLAALQERHVGNVFLAGRSGSGVGATAAVTGTLRRAAVAGSGVQPFVATDQEGGYVQVLTGPGFSRIPSALEQAGLPPADLRISARTWGGELARAGVNVNFAPVMDTVDSAAAAAANPPIGRFLREYGYTPPVVTAHATAFAAGMRDAGISAVPKHFPGLGRVPANTDTAADVTDVRTTRNDAALGPFRAAVASGARWMMLSNARYQRIDPANIGPFSPTIIQGMLRHDLGFTGIVVSDDLCNAKALSPWTPGERATRFLAAGGTMALCTNQNLLAPMYDAALALARKDAGFRAKVEAAALKVLQVKAGG
ncbi:glycoside hydrolase family 3 N-terminal domain-containing protein [Paenarthrobacter sp. DKR-5]|uniref:glycoside hydrolase family 3 N-terminal domain-containing protein n=1 Tax=Paenarthrobacter sp. DKR-5 TaxID=2835535 RepID=UPI0027DE4585|nr:glycoside hydrolase family 3 N-terminal domain-containing protein [Paenarthrobacter sp. DKR-5]